MKVTEIRNLTKGLTKIAMMNAIEENGGTLRSVMEKNKWSMTDIRKKYVNMGLVQKAKEEIIQKEKKEETMNKEQEAKAEEVKQEQATESKQESKKAESVFDLVAILQKAGQELDGEVIDVKPNGKGLKVGRTRICAIYINRNGWVRMKTNKVDEAYNLLGEYSTTIEIQTTADKRDVILDFIWCDEDLVVSFIKDLADRNRQTKAAKAEAREQVKAAKAQVKAEEKAAKAAAKAAEKEAKEKAKAAEKAAQQEKPEEQVEG